MVDDGYRICTRCVMDTSDPEIKFDDGGVCNHCFEFDTTIVKRWFPNDAGECKLREIVNNVKKAGNGSEYDCIIGLSGGVDSSYLAVALKDYGLRPLVVHVDAGWNSELAVYNIEQVVKHCDYELYTHVMDWEEIRDLQLAYLKAGVANQDVVQDHAFFSVLYHFAVKNNISYVISGGNIATESVLPKAWHHDAMDALNILDIHNRFGTMPLRQYKTISFFQYYFYYPFFRRMKVIRPLNFMPFNKGTALSDLKQKIGYKEYGGKHGESRFTKFFQNYYLPTKFGIDKRRAHLSSLILSGELTRELALVELEKPMYDKVELAEDKAFVAKKLGITLAELDQLMAEHNHVYSEYANWDFRYKIAKKCQHFLEALLGRDVKNYA